ncbi:uncharacterized protein (TIGR03083 family) [Allocatelliglobosispora scoriae]|uniref:Uncharacterized protein (TIGR03083 family) n=1 Tax=Allocatelliglobosispora scoriae TaxID=643052 RepID=A0A841BDN4_9ACTN|nr:histidine phosphatase family protein [Allocatelliglobosispora scoriae]MBB5867217.1 uncharacterized protein (TIGR03083 family) [Allocatelliglobosispora scoriae]
MAVDLVYETHSVTLDNETGHATGWLPGELSADGIDLARALGERRRGTGLHAVYCSDLHRAVQTAELAFGGTGIPIITDTRLREVDYGAWNGMPHAKLHSERGARIDVPFPGGQSYREVTAHMADLLRDLAARHDGEHILLIGHAATRHALATLLGGATLRGEVIGEFRWRTGWPYTLPADWDGGHDDLALHAITTEAAALTDALRGADLGVPTRCAPWDARDLLAHVQLTLSRTTTMLTTAPPGGEPLTAAGYYDAPGLFDPATDTARLDEAHHQRATPDTFDNTWRAAVTAAGWAAPDRLVRTRHGHPIRLGDYLRTRVVELAVHGLDLADALGRAPWLTEPAARVTDRLLRELGDPDGLGWDRDTFLRKATGRAPLTASEAAALTERGLRWLTLAAS